MKFEHKEKGWSIEVVELTQAMAEAFADGVYAVGNPLKKNRIAVQGALECGWLKIIKPGGLHEDNLAYYKDPSLVNWIMQEITPIYAEAITIPKN